MATPALGRWADWRRASVFVAAGVLTQAGAKWPHDVGLMLSHSLCMRRHMVHTSSFSQFCEGGEACMHFGSEC